MPSITRDDFRDVAEGAAVGAVVGVVVRALALLDDKTGATRKIKDALHINKK